jgi:hypothetical protein
MSSLWILIFGVLWTGIWGVREFRQTLKYAKIGFKKTAIFHLVCFLIQFFFFGAFTLQLFYI